MKKVIYIGLSVLLLSACGSVEARGDKRFTNSYYSYPLTITKDNKTGCKYLLYDRDRGAGITPLLNSDGTPDCK